MVLLALNSMPIFVFLKILVTFLIWGCGIATVTTAKDGRGY
jgi:hypothetical protein